MISAALHPSVELSARAGATLVEVLMAVVLLGLLAVAGGAHLYHARAIVAIQRNRLIATELTTGRIEQLHSSRPAAIQPPGPGIYYLAPTGTTWALTQTDPGDSVTLNHRSFPMQSTVEWRDLQQGVTSNHYLRLTVSTAHRPETDDRVTLSTLYAP